MQRKMIFAKFAGAGSALCTRASRIVGLRHISMTPKLGTLHDGKYRWKQYFRSIIGNREQVGYGWNGQPCYEDTSLFPFPSIRYKEPTADLKALHEKEKGDWKELTIAEKKCLYRASFCQTFAEFQAFTGTWKTIVGCALVLVSIGLWLNVFMYTFVYSQTPIPTSFTPENIRAQMRRQLDLHINPITGISAKWDYEKGEWKNPDKWFQPANPYIDPDTGDEECNNYRE